jgi:branched-chain amino acid transport system permease protein
MIGIFQRRQARRGLLLFKEEAVHYFISGLAMGSVYALMALAINIVFSTTGIINFAHATVIMLGAMTSYWCLAVFNFSYPISILIAIVVTCMVNILIYKGCVERLGDLGTNLGWIVTTFGAAIIIENSCRIAFGTEPQAYPSLFNGMMVNIGGIDLMIHEILMLAIAIVAGVSYETLMQKTRFGRAVRAVAFKPDIARLMGIQSEAVIIACFFMSGLLAAVAGALIAPITFVSYTMTSFIGIKGFAAALVGGLGNSKGAFVGGIVLGLIEAIVGMYGSVALKNAFSFAVMIIVIIFLPGGVLGAKFFSKNRASVQKI